MKTQTVRVRVNVLGIRLIGFVSLPPGEFSRFSDVLNGDEPYILIRSQEPTPEAREAPSLPSPVTISRTTSASRAVRKESISYVEALTEPAFQRTSPQGAFEAVRVSLKNPAVTLLGELFVPKDMAAIDVFNSARRFINLRNVEFCDSDEAYDFLAVGKAQAYSIELVLL